MVAIGRTGVDPVVRPAVLVGGVVDVAHHVDPVHVVVDRDGPAGAVVHNLGGAVHEVPPADRRAPVGLGGRPDAVGRRDVGRDAVVVPRVDQPDKVLPRPTNKSSSTATPTPTTATTTTTTPTRRAPKQERLPTACWLPAGLPRTCRSITMPPEWRESRPATAASIASKWLRYGSLPGS